jgi:hypothetical protein
VIKQEIKAAGFPVLKEYAQEMEILTSGEIIRNMIWMKFMIAAILREELIEENV